MKILVDENIPQITVNALRATDHDVLDIRGTPQQGMFDDELWRLAQAAGQLLITRDKGFSTRAREQHAGIRIVRLRQPNEQAIHSRVMLAINRFAPGQWPNMLVVMRDSVQSVRRSP